ncbi:hypothetical protein [Okeania sp.]|uniref:hypothetical protein n=1 Tax=Okeania sp. TaxID=3100323 RepID=UPI002B4B354A|nr:hypothetical protein [Okeania sp.]MEB3339766.1 hypothetical protein [Okeania sp.]
MSKSSTTRINFRSPGIDLLILCLIFRLLLLVVASGFSWVLGMAIAVQYPSNSQEIPIVEKFFHGSNDRENISRTFALIFKSYL